MALLLAAVGIYGVMSFVVAERTREIGLRMALGARRSRIVGQVVREGMVTALAGTALGLLGAWLVGRTMQSAFLGVSGADPLALAGVVLVLQGAAVAACFVPAWRAASVDPMTALREE